MATISTESKIHDRPHVFFAAFFVLFALGLLLLQYAIGSRFYEAMGMSVPLATSWFQLLTPWPMIVVAVVSLAVLNGARSRMSPSGSVKLAWSIIGCAAFITMWGTFQLVSPMLSILSGLGKL